MYEPNVRVRFYMSFVWIDDASRGTIPRVESRHHYAFVDVDVAVLCVGV